jgi:hypothetical protein
MSQRSITKLIAAQATSDGAGVKLYRSIGSAAQPELDPFLLLDEFFSDDAADYIAGFPDHPHRGFETVTYMLDGTMRHQDNTGNGGSLGPGGVQWMTAGRGIIHSEMPEQVAGRMRGFQLWVNLPAALKMCAPRYQNLEPGEIPEVVTDAGVRIRVIAGQSENVTGAVDGINVDPLYLDITVPAEATFRQAIPAGHAAFAYGIEGEATLGGKTMPGRHLAVLNDGDELVISAGPQPVRLLLIAARSLNEPIVRYGPFVMNSRAEIEDAVRDYQSGRF